MVETLYRRPLPADMIPFSSSAGRQVFAEALAHGGLDGYFPLAEQFHTQSEPAFCGLGSLVVALNALAIDPGRLWKGPWRWFAEDLLDCCVSLDEVRVRGLDLDELACLARCNGADVELHRADRADLSAWRSTLTGAARGDFVVIASYDRAALDQTGAGHFSPIGGYHAERDLALVLDVARFKYPPHWISAERLWHAMQPIDPGTKRARGWMVLRRRERGLALGVTLSCPGKDLQAFAHRLSAVVTEVGRDAAIEQLARALEPLVANTLVRAPTSDEHERALARARAALHELAVFGQVARTVGEEHADAVTLLLLALADRFAPPRRDEIAASIAGAAHEPALAAEIDNLRAQLDALWIITNR